MAFIKLMNLLVLALFTFPFLDSHAQTNAPAPSPSLTPTPYSIPRYTFVVEDTVWNAPCRQTIDSILTVNGSIPGPEIRVKGNQSVLIQVINNASLGFTIHWHGVKQPRNPWADGPEHVTQCPILPGQNYTYNISLSDEVGTLWWHAHADWTRHTIHGALAILPPDDEVDKTSPVGSKVLNHTIIFASWYNINSEQLDVQGEHLENYGNLTHTNPDLFLMNGRAGDKQECNSNEESTVMIHSISVKSGETHLLRIVNAAMIEPQYFGITGHNLTVVARDGALVEQFSTPYILIFPGETYDVQFVANQSAATYYMAFTGFSNLGAVVTGLVSYEGIQLFNDTLPTFPIINTDVGSGMAFINQTKSPENRTDVVPQGNVTRYTILVNQLANIDCTTSEFCEGDGSATFAHLNNVSFLPNMSDSILDAYHFGRSNVYGTTFPTSVLDDLTRPQPPQVIEVDYGTAVEIVFQGALLTTGPPYHPMHLHGYSFFRVGMGNGTFNPDVHVQTYNLTHPPEVNTAALFRSGWTAIRFYANNPGCGAEEESWIHLLRDCYYAASVWKELKMGSDFFRENGPQWINHHAVGRIGSSATTLPSSTLFLFTVWGIWKARNLLIFEGQRPPAAVTAKIAATRAMEFHKARTTGRIFLQNQPQPKENWTPPQRNFYKLNSDGSVRADIAAAGGLIRNHQGEWIGGFSMNIGPSSIHDSELWGMRQGLLLALRLEIKNLVVELDSTEVIQALSENRDINAPAPALLLDCKGLLLKFADIKLQHTARETNSAADFLAKLGHNLPPGVTTHETAPAGLATILCNDILGHGP